jgi:MYXO-CTERM domain-containing protein
MMRTSGVLSASSGLVALLVLAAPGAEARIDGHPGATGRPGGGTCNRCHSPQTYDGMSIQFTSSNVRQRDCFETNDAGELSFVNSIYTVPYGGQVLFDLKLADPPTGDPNASPPVPGLFCPEGSTCGDAVAGFGIEVTGSDVGPGDPPVLFPNNSESGMKQAGEGDLETASRTEVNHSTPRAFSGGEAKWSLVLNVPSATLNNATTLNLYASGNACNANGAADQGDISALTSAALYFEYGAGNGEHTGPTCDEACAEAGGLTQDGGCACPEGQTFTAQGFCAEVGGCSHVQARAGGTAAAGLAALLALAFAIRRRRR